VRPSRTDPKSIWFQSFMSSARNPAASTNAKMLDRWVGFGRIIATVAFPGQQCNGASRLKLRNAPKLERSILPGI
jgi:hypothetical protein